MDPETSNPCWEKPVPSMFRTRAFLCPFWRPAAAALLGLTLAACAGGGGERAAPFVPPPQGFLQTVAHDPADRLAHARPRIVTPARKLQCVPYARRHSRIEIRGDAWTWWGKAKGRYRRGSKPAVGSVLVLGRKGASRGHLAVVTRVVGDREVIASHANWLNRGQVHIDTPIRDVSPNNDWSAVRVWYTPADVLGKSVYPAYGFIYPPTDSAERT
jgi:hypothetical protein